MRELLQKGQAIDKWTTKKNCSYQKSGIEAKLKATHESVKILFAIDKQQLHSHDTVSWSTRDSEELPANWLLNSTAYGNGKKNGFSWHWAQEHMRQYEQLNKCINHTKYGNLVPTNLLIY